MTPSVQFHKDGTDDEPSYLVEIDGEEIGYIYKEFYYIPSLGLERIMSEWALDASLEARFGENFAAGHKRVQSVMKEIRQAVRDGK